MKSKLLKTVIIIFASGFIISCATFATVVALPEFSSESKKVFSKNYSIGVQQKKFVGEELIKVKDYTVRGKNQNKMEALNDFQIKAIWDSIYGKKGDTFTIDGMSYKGDIPVYLLRFPAWSTARFGISKEGNYADFLIDDKREIKPTIGISFLPPNTRFRMVEKEVIDVSAGFINFEIVFTGITQQSINLLYREYSPEDIARAAFYQNLTYPLNSETIRFKKIKMRIHEVTNESLTYIVMEDGL